ncbi:Tyrosine-protein kinase HCK [Halotydeus destructor]|nr:Tyrosine-protein kinase HCK [Halotydeus destructor]
MGNDQSKNFRSLPRHLMRRRPTSGYNQLQDDRDPILSSKLRRKAMSQIIIPPITLDNKNGKMAVRIDKEEFSIAEEVEDDIGIQIGTPKLRQLVRPQADNADKIETETFFFGNTTRNQADQLLLDNATKTGTYLVRYANSPDGYAISMLYKPQNGDSLVKHYKVTTVDGLFAISTHRMFKSVQDLIDYYSVGNHGICCPLSYPLTKLDAKFRPQADDCFVRRNTLRHEDIKSARRHTSYLPTYVEIKLSVPVYL